MKDRKHSKRIKISYALSSMIYYQSNLEVEAESFPLSSENGFLGKGATKESPEFTSINVCHQFSILCLKESIITQEY
jgi:hypothetical protein